MITSVFQNETYSILNAILALSSKQELCYPSWTSSLLIWIVDSGLMIREAFLAATGLD